MNSRIVSAFRIIAFVEALTWLGLLIGMYFKWIAETGEAGREDLRPDSRRRLHRLHRARHADRTGAALVVLDDGIRPRRVDPAVLHGVVRGLGEARSGRFDCPSVRSRCATVQRQSAVSRPGKSERDRARDPERGRDAGHEPGRHLHPWPPRQRAALAPLADGGELRRIPAPAPAVRPILLDIGCGPGTITLDLAELVAPGQTVGVDREVQPLISARAAAVERGVHNVASPSATSTSWTSRTDSFDVVHAHQLLQHLTDPVAALIEMRRVCRPGGIVAARDADYAAMTWYPADPRLDRWLELYHQVARGNGAEPDAGRRLLAWARAAGYRDVTGTATVWCYSTKAELALVGRPVGGPDHPVRARPPGVVRRVRGRAGAGRPGRRLRDWATHDDAWFAVLNAEILCRVA